jgi:hypothetical protein
VRPAGGPGRALCPPRSGAWGVGSIGGWCGVSSMSHCAVSVSPLLAVRRRRSWSNRLLRWAWGVANRTAGHGVLPVAPLGMGCCRTIARRHDDRCMAFSLLSAYAPLPRDGGAMTPLEIELPPLGMGCCRALAPGGARTGAWGADAAMRHRVCQRSCPHGARASVAARPWLLAVARPRRWLAGRIGAWGVGGAARRCRAPGRSAGVAAAGGRIGAWGFGGTPVMPASGRWVGAGAAGGRRAAQQHRQNNRPNWCMGFWRRAANPGRQDNGRTRCMGFFLCRGPQGTAREGGGVVGARRRGPARRQPAAVLVHGIPRHRR